MYKKGFSLLLLFVLMQAAQAQKTTTAADAKMNAFLTALLKKMTVDEKIGQLNLPSVGFDVTGPVLSQGVDEKIKKGLVGGVFNTFTPVAVRKLQERAVNETRLKIPLLFGYDVVHGHRTIFPVPLGLSASWDLNLIERTARAAAEEASADGLNWTFSPMVDIARDPRWGRIAEGGGEDPYLGSQIARVMVKGYQGDDLSRNNTILACVKHFALYGAAEAGRDYNTVDMSLPRMYNEYLPPYKAAIDAGAATVMASFNDINGVPATANKWLLTDLLRKSWGFKGMVVSDYTGVYELVNHGLGTFQQVSALSLKAGTDMDMVSEGYINTLKQSLQEGKITLAEIEASCRRVLEAKYKLGLFDDPYRYVNEDRAKEQIMSADKLDLSREAAQKSMVLLKNAANTLPLKGERKMAFIGPLVKDKRNLIGPWSGAGDWTKATSIWEALQQKFPGNTIAYAKGCNLLDDTTLANKLNPHGAMIVPDSLSPQQLLDQAVQTAAGADVLVVALGESFAMSGEAASRSNIELPDNQKALLHALKKTGKPIVLVLLNGRPLALQWEHDNLEAIVESWFPGTMGGEAIVNVLFGVYNPSGKLSATFPRSVGQVPIYYSAKSTGRPFDEGQKYTSKYLDVSNTPLYPFGYGLSYTTFRYDSVQLNKNSITANEVLTASTTVTNTGAYDGEETVQLYIQDVVGSSTRPLKELKGFQKIYLRKGESKPVTFTIAADDLRFWNSDLKRVTEPGAFNVFIGTSSADVKQATFQLTAGKSTKPL
ncbi:MAG TPA: beta-glucosidase BglX [Chitinophagaceae bacterium]|nr:beta-glucosidase BglX [Chitinophagaceae bacterium]